MPTAAKDTGRGSVHTTHANARGASPYIITEDSHNSEIQKPRTLLQALSDIQQFSVMENRGRVIPGDIFTLQMTVDYMTVGFRSGFKEGLLLFLLMPVVEFWLIPKMTNPDWSIQLLFHGLPYLQLVAYTMICGFMANYYSGNITKKAINAVLSGRIMMLVFKAIAIWFLFNLLFAWGTETRVWCLTEKLHLTWEASANVCSWFFQIKPLLVPTGNRGAGILLVGGILPYGALLGSDWWKRWRIRRNTRLVSGS